MASIGAQIDKLYELREERRAHEAEISEINGMIKGIEEILIGQMNENGLSLGRGSLATVSIKETMQPKVVDWTEFHRYIRDNDRFDLLHKRVTSTAWQAMYEEGIVVPGSEPVSVTSILLRKI